MLAGRVSRREPQAERREGRERGSEGGEEGREGRASVNNESIDPPADDGSGCHGDRCSVALRSLKKMLLFPRTAPSWPGNGVRLGFWGVVVIYLYYIKRAMQEVMEEKKTRHSRRWSVF